MKIKISVVIVTYNSANLIQGCIDSIFEFNDIEDELLEIIVVDNSTKEVSETMFRFLKDLYGNKIKLIWAGRNLGYGSGNNLGIRHSSGEIICIINPDVRLIEPVFFNTCKEFKNNPNLGLIGYKQVGGKNISFLIKPEFYIPILNPFIIKIANKLHLFSPKYFYLSGAFMFLHKKKFEVIGMFDENIFLYREEPDISNRLKNKQYEIKYIPKIKYHHLIDNRNFLSENSFIHWVNSVSYYCDKYNLSKAKYFKKQIIEFNSKILYSQFNKKKKGNYIKLKKLLKIHYNNIGQT